MRRSATSFLRLPGLLLAVLALAGLIAVGSLGPVDARADGPLAELAAAMGQCRSPPPGDPGRDTHRHRAPDCAPAVAAAELAAPALLAAPSPEVPLRRAAVAVRMVSWASARAPPSHDSHTGYPRGPPVLA